jgi:hypothetical protein
MGQFKMIEIKEAAEKGRNGKTETVEKKRNVNYGLIGILCRDSDPMTNPPRTQLPRGKDPDGHEVDGKQRRLKAQYLWDIPEPDTVSKSAQSAPDSYLRNTSVPRCHSTVTSKTPACHVVTRQLLPKHQRATLSPDGCSHIITQLLPSAWPAQPVLIRPLSLKRRCYLQSLGGYL